MIELSSEISAHLGIGATAFDRIFSLVGQRFRFREGRETLRVEIGGQNYFLKRHHGYGWKWILKSLLTGGYPIISALSEVAIIRRLKRIGIPSVEVVGFGQRGRNPATRQSFLLMRELVGCHDLDKLTSSWPTQPPTPKLRRVIVESLATTARAMHSAGINHRDFHLDHLWFEPATAEDSRPRLHVIDLHRAMHHRRVSLYWRTKDLAGLLLTAWDRGITKSDCLRFVLHYAGRSAREVFRTDRLFWRIVVWRADRLFRREFGHPPPQPLIVPKVVERSRGSVTAFDRNLRCGRAETSNLKACMKPASPPSRLGMPT